MILELFLICMHFPFTGKSCLTITLRCLHRFGGGQTCDLMTQGDLCLSCRTPKWQRKPAGPLLLEQPTVLTNNQAFEHSVAPAERL